MNIQVLSTEGCSSYQETYDIVVETAGLLAPGAKVQLLKLELAELDSCPGFYGSPTVRIDGRDLEGRQGPPSGSS